MHAFEFEALKNTVLQLVYMQKNEKWSYKIHSVDPVNLISHEIRNNF